MLGAAASIGGQPRPGPGRYFFVKCWYYRIRQINKKIDDINVVKLRKNKNKPIAYKVYSIENFRARSAR